jgi:hypothetical protein
MFFYSLIDGRFVILADQCPRMQIPTDGSRFTKKSLCVRMRSSLTKRAPNMKTPGYRVRYYSIVILNHSIDNLVRTNHWRISLVTS